MKSAWSIEFARILLLLVSIILFGLVTEQWLLSVILYTSLYIGWNVFQLRIFERWISHGAPKKNAPDASGVWQLIVQHIYRSQKSNKDRKKHLTKVANHYHAVMSALPDATIVLNENLEIEWVNKKSEELLGIVPSTDMGQRFDNIIRDLDLQILFDSDLEQSTIEIVSPVLSHITLALTRKKYAKDKTLLIARDISQRLALQQLRKDFIANASHELRTPLTVISGYLEMIDAEDELPTAIAPYVKNAIEQGLRMEQILNDLLMLSKLEEKKYYANSGEVVEISKLLKRLIADFEVANTETKHQFELHLDQSLNLLVVEQEFFSLCQNLLSNAVKYSPNASIIDINWSLNDEQQACLAITDQGEGIAAEHISRLTERFYRINVERSKKVAGTGLGLSIVKHILDNYGGYLDIQSIQQQGSTFKACFPKSRTLQ